jgi:uncharacterized protein (DUF885 family)
MTTVFDVSDHFTEQWADLDPISATVYGIAGRDHLPTDFTPEGHAARADLFRATRDRLRPHLDDRDPGQARSAKVLLGFLDQAVDDYEARLWAWDLNHVASPFQHMQDVFDVMPKESAEDWAAIISRLRAFDDMLAGYRRSLEVGIEAGDTAAARQTESVIEQVEATAGEESRFNVFMEEAAAAGADLAEVTAAVDEARQACSGFAGWLRQTYLSQSTLEDGVGRERYMRGVDRFLGMSIDPDETYQWGWSEVHRLLSEMEETAADIDPAMTIDEVIELLETDPARSAATREEFVAFISALQQQAISQLDGDHFDVHPALKTVTVSIAPPGGSLGAWYHGPSEDLTRPGSIWYAPGERERLPYWQEVTTAYHEGFPGHHLQVGTAVLQRDRLSRFERMVLWYSGSGEGWALYAERLMDELGFFEKPEYRLGLLASQLFRATRVVVDIGCHLGKVIPDNAPLHAGEEWSYETAVDYMQRVGRQPQDVAESEVKRYLGWWAQAISYKVGEREILDIRDQAMTRAGNGFDMKDFHRRMLEGGAIRLDHLREEML